MKTMLQREKTYLLNQYIHFSSWTVKSIFLLVGNYIKIIRIASEALWGHTGAGVTAGETDMEVSGGLQHPENPAWRGHTAAPFRNAEWALAPTLAGKRALLPQGRMRTRWGEETLQPGSLGGQWRRKDRGDF